MSQSVNQTVQFKDEQGRRQIDILSCSPTGEDNEYKLSGIIWDATLDRKKVEKTIIYTGAISDIQVAIGNDAGLWRIDET